MPIISIVLMILLTTVRHEGSHAVAAWLSDVPIHEIRLLPGVHPELGFYFGYVSRGDGGGWVIDAAPYLSAILWLAVLYPLVRCASGNRQLRLPLLFIGVVSPLVDLVYNYQGGLWRAGTDVHDLFLALPDPAVHVYFVSAIATSLAAFLHLRQRSTQHAD